MKQNKQTIKLNEKQLRQVIEESIKKVLNEGYDMMLDNGDWIYQSDIRNAINDLQKKR